MKKVLFISVWSLFLLLASTVVVGAKTQTKKVQTYSQAKRILLEMYCTDQYSKNACFNCENTYVKSSHYELGYEIQNAWYHLENKKPTLSVNECITAGIKIPLNLTNEGGLYIIQKGNATKVNKHNAKQHFINFINEVIKENRLK